MLIRGEPLPSCATTPIEIDKLSAANKTANLRRGCNPNSQTSYSVNQNRRGGVLPSNVHEAIRQRDGFTGFRYDLLVAATFVRAGFRVEPEDETEIVRI